MSQATPDQLTPDLMKCLTAVDTPTICNAMDLVFGSRTNEGFTHGSFVTAFPAMKPVLGFARTGAIRMSSPYTESARKLRERRLGWYRHIEAKGLPTIAVVEDIDDEPGFAAFFGEVHSNVLKGLGILGALTNGALRDIGMLAQEFQILAGCISPSHAFAQVVSFGGEATIKGLTIADGDLLHMDMHGAVIVPAEALPDLPRAIEIMTARERPLIDASRRSGFSVDALEEAMREADAIKY